MLIIKEKIPVGASKVDDFGDHGAHIGEARREYEGKNGSNVLLCLLPKILTYSLLDPS